MKKTIFLILLFACFSTQAQEQANNFEINEGLDIHIGPNTADSIWQIGIPQKTLLDSAFSLPYALITDTVNTYGTDLNSSFTIILNEYTVWGFPYLQVEWIQKTDLEEGVDGGVIEVSYDDGLTWLNVFDDPNFRPDMVGNFEWDSLYNGQAGITGTNDWQWMAICWGSNTGTLPYGFSELHIRFTMISDSIDTQQEGWMIDDFYVFGGVVGNLSNISNSKPISVHPNPTQENLTIDLSEIESNNAILEIYSNSGQRMLVEKLQTNGLANYTIETIEYPNSLYYLFIKTEDEIYHQKFIKQH